MTSLVVIPMNEIIFGVLPPRCFGEKLEPFLERWLRILRRAG
jgi:hypothetical protein